MSLDLLKQIIQLENLLTLRIHLRELIEIDNLNIKAPFTAVSKTFKEIKLVLPDYCRPCIIKDAISKKSDIFDISVNDKVNNKNNRKIKPRVRKRVEYDENYNF